MKRCSLLLFILFLLLAVSAFATEQAETVQDKNCRQHMGKNSGSGGPGWCAGDAGTCSTEKRGRCGKRRGDWYGASQPVTSAEEAHRLFVNYFAGQQYTISRPIEKKWGFMADILDRNGAIIDQVMIDKRSGRIRSLH